ncbi:MAG: GNAT family N-acetyltransferase [Flavobacteriales bacterium]
MEKITWIYKHFSDLTALEYHHILFLRTEIFVVEQNCPYQEVDKKDVVSYHLYGTNSNNEVVAVTRIVPQNVSYKEISIGRVAINKKYRGTGLAHELILKTFEAAENIFGKQAIRISAQEYLLNYYTKHGFNKVGEMYLEDDIPHVEMLRPAIIESSVS